MDLVANTVMRFAHGPEMHAWFRGTGKNPIVIFVALPAFLEQIEHFLAHGQSTSAFLVFPRTMKIVRLMKSMFE